MAKLPDYIKKVAENVGLRNDDFWDCHGTWVAYHRSLERAAAEQGIAFDDPQVLEKECPTVSIFVRGRLGEKSEWSIGEASPKNNKNAYPWAMAEKRAKDRVILKLLGLHGVYSEEEADDFKESAPTEQAPPVKRQSQAAHKRDGTFEDICAEIRATLTPDELREWGVANRERMQSLPTKWIDPARDAYANHMDELNLRFGEQNAA